MRKIIPFKKQFSFKTNVSEITSISLENTLHNNDKEIEGELIITGTYKITETSTQVDKFEFKIPINIEIDPKYDTENMKIDINDFYYEIINNTILEVNIEILIDNIIELEEKTEQEIQKEQPIKIEPERNNERCIEEENETVIEEPALIKNIFENFKEEQEDYSTYHVYIVRENDSLDTILSKYNTTKETINEYNDISEIRIGDKIIIPQNDDRDK